MQFLATELDLWAAAWKDTRHGDSSLGARFDGTNSRGEKSPAKSRQSAKSILNIPWDTSLVKAEKQGSVVVKKKICVLLRKPRAGIKPGPYHEVL